METVNVDCALMFNTKDSGRVHEGQVLDALISIVNEKDILFIQHFGNKVHVGFADQQSRSIVYQTGLFINNRHIDCHEIYIDSVSVVLKNIPPHIPNFTVAAFIEQYAEVVGLIEHGFVKRRDGSRTIIRTGTRYFRVRNVRTPLPSFPEISNFSGKLFYEGQPCQHCAETTHAGNRCPSRQMTSRRVTSCYRCGEEGHFARDCVTDEVICFACGQVGHTQANCSVIRADEEDREELRQRQVVNQQHTNVHPTGAANQAGPLVMHPANAIKKIVDAVAATNHVLNRVDTYNQTASTPAFNPQAEINERPTDRVEARREDVESQKTPTRSAEIAAQASSRTAPTCVLIGDSLLHMMQNSDNNDRLTLSTSGLSIEEVHEQSRQLHTCEKTEVVVIQTGTNNLIYRNETPCECVVKYNSLLNEVKSTFPNADIVVSGIPPVNSSGEENGNIDSTNFEIQKICGSKLNVHFLDNKRIFMDSQGVVYKKDFKQSDRKGVHMTNKGQEKLRHNIERAIRSVKKDRQLQTGSATPVAGKRKQRHSTGDPSPGSIRPDPKLLRQY